VKIYADTGFTRSDAAYKGEISEDLEKKFATGWSARASSLFDWGQTIIGIIGSVIGLANERREALADKKGWKVKSMAEFAAVAAEIGKLAYTLKKAAQADETPGSVSIHAEHEVGVVAGGVLEMFGQTGAGISSPITVDLIGGTVGAKAATFASVWAGVNASLTAGKEASVSGGSEVRIKSKKEVNITGGTEVKIGAGTAAVMSAEKEYAVVFGKEFVYVAAEGYGMKATEKDLAIGKMTSPSNYKSAAGADSPILKMADKSINAKCGSCTITMDGTAEKMEIHAGHMKITSSSGVIEASNGKILIDG